MGVIVVEVVVVMLVLLKVIVLVVGLCDILVSGQGRELSISCLFLACMYRDRGDCLRNPKKEDGVRQEKTVGLFEYYTLMMMIMNVMMMVTTIRCID